MSNHKVSSASGRWPTLVDLARDRAATQADLPLYTFLSATDAADHHTARSLDAQARAIAAALQQHCRAGDRALILLQPGLDYIAAFFGCLYAGVIAVPLYPPQPGRRAEQSARLQAIVRETEPTAVLLATRAAESVESLLATLPPRDLHRIAVDSLDSAAAAWAMPALGPEDLAFLQYTSGSTGNPKGVMVSHANLLANLAAIHQFFGHSQASRGVIWLPPYHDMGLIGGLLQPLFGGFPVTLLAPVDFLRQPLRWLKLISETQATTSGAPNFAYDLCASRLADQREPLELDLSRWEVAFTGAELVRPATLRAFERECAPYGFRPQAFFPCYGLAESTLIVSGGEVHAPPVIRSFDPAMLTAGRAVAQSAPAAAQPHELVSVGRPLPPQEIAIVDPDGRRCEPGRIGEIWLAGPSTAQGYWRRPEETSATFTARLADADADGNPLGGAYLRTGDLGFLHDDQLFITGRIKELIIIRGRNYAPQDIEAIAEASSPAFRRAGCAAFSIDGGSGEQLVIVQELERHARQPDVAQLAAAIRRAVAEQLELSVAAVALIKAGGLPKTSSGKIQRHRCRDQYLAGTLPLIGIHAPQAQGERAGSEAREAAGAATALEHWLRDEAAAALAIDPAAVDTAATLSALGLDSLAAVTLQHRIEARVGAIVGIDALLGSHSIASLARTIAGGPALGGASVTAPAEGLRSADPLAGIAMQPSASSGPLALAQQRLWFLDQLDPGTPATNIFAAVEIDGLLDYDRLNHGLAAVIDRQAALRTRIEVIEGAPRQTIAPAGSFAVERRDWRGMEPQQQQRRLAEAARNAAHERFDLARGGLLRITAIQLAERRHALLLTIHHIVADGWSMRVLIDDLAHAMRQPPGPLGGAAPRQEPLALRYLDYAAWQHDWLAGPEFQADLAYWRGQLQGRLPLLSLPTDHQYPRQRTAEGGRQLLEIGPELTATLERIGRQSGATLFMALAASLGALLHRYTGQDDLLLGTPAAQRTHAATKNLIGCFVNTLVLRLKPQERQRFCDLLAATRETALAAYRHQGLPFERLVEELHPERRLNNNPLLQVLLALQPDPLETAELPGLAARLLPLDPGLAQFDLEFNLTRSGDRLTGWIQYSRDIFEPATIERLADHWLNLLASAAANPALPLADLALLDQAQRSQIVTEWNDTAAPFGDTDSLHRLVSRQARRTPEALAVLDGDRALTYAELDRRSTRLARLLRSRGVGPGDPVAVYLDRRASMIVALLGILKAGGAYVPVEPSWPARRICAILEPLPVTCAITHPPLLRAFYELRWRLPGLTDVVCLDAPDWVPPSAGVDAESVRALWDHVSDQAIDEITAGGFISSYTGQPFSAEEVAAYRRHVAGLAAPWLRPDARVLEIGCGSGALMFEFANAVKSYCGLDPSAQTQRRNREIAAQRGLAGIDLITGFAHEIGDLAEGPFDLILIASTLQFFPDPQYAMAVLRDAAALLAPGGAIVCADVMDLRQRDAFAASLAAFAEHHGDPSAVTKTRLGSELYLEAAFFEELAGQLPAIGALRVVERTAAFANELRYRFDIVMTNNIAAASAPSRRLWTDWHLAQHPAEDLPDEPAADRIAYILHTSGSTGQPKGVMVQHRPVINVLEWVNRNWGVGPGDRLLLVTALTFDLSVYDIFGGLSAGAAIRVASNAELADPDRLAAILADESITMWNSAPPAMQRLVPLLRPSDRLRLILLSGDWLPLTLPDALRERFPAAEIVNLGGATEATIWSNAYRIGRIDPEWPHIPYGTPIQNARYYVLDRSRNLCPINVEGDLYIGGRCLALGYLSPAQTAERFVPDPFSAEAGARMYDTGDRARFWADGTIEFLGRRDQQVKIRGFRIELGEIEAALAQHPMVRTAVAIARETGQGDKQLVAYLVARQTGGAPPDAEMRAWLSSRLPEYMLPGAWVWLPALPLSSNGKLDRDALPAPAALARDAGWEAPQTKAEERIAVIWAELLGQPRIGRGDNFFGLGGHSLLATQVLARVRAAFGSLPPLSLLFEEPTLRGFAAAVAASDSAPVADGPADDGPRPIRRQHRGDAGSPPAASHAQERLWFLDRLDPGSAAYTMPAAVELDGALDDGALEASFQSLAARHESLRTTFPAVEGQPVQAIAAGLPAPLLRLIDLSDLAGAEQAASLDAIIDEEARAPFDLARGPLLRATRIKLGDDRAVLLLTLHHIISDGWSMRVLIRDLSRIYQARRAGATADLPELAIQYADFAAWERARQDKLAAGADLAVWQTRLAGAPPYLALPTDRPRSAQATATGATLSAAVEADLRDGLARLARDCNATLFMVMLAGFNLLLARHSGQDDILVGTPVANRLHPATEDLIGLFINMLVLRTSTAGDPPFTAYLAQVRERTLEALNYQHVPFELVVERLQPERSLLHHPLFQVVFDFQAPPPPLDLAGLTVRPLRAVYEVPTGTAKFDLACGVVDAGGALTIAFEYNRDLYAPETIQRLLDRYIALLRLIVAAPATPIKRLGLVSPAEAAELAAILATGGTAPLAGGSLDQRVRAQAERTPDAIAIIDGGRQIRYRALIERAWLAAGRIRGLDLPPHAPIAIYCRRSIEQIVGMLAVMAAGHPYLPLDPAYPPGRIAAVLADSQALAGLTTADLAGSATPGPTWLDLNAIADGPGGAVPLAAHDRPAYVIYTSGSTGVPKGVVIAHGAASHYLSAVNEHLRLTADDRVLQFASASFDASVEEIFGALVHGSTLVLRDDDAASSLQRLAEQCREHAITVLNLPTSYWHELVGALEAGSIGLPPTIRLVLIGSERAHPERVAAWQRLVGDQVRLLNEYGPTETTVGATIADLTAAPIEGDNVPIGLPLAGVRAYVLDQDLRQVPPGVVGELYLGGAALAYGYLGQPALTAERFIPDPFAGEALPGRLPAGRVPASGRLYRTGDWVRLDPRARTLLYVGRRDAQIKLRGIRIETGEIEAALCAHPAVAQAAVILDEPAGGQARLIAYIVPAGPGEPDQGDLRGWLGRHLPRQLVPSLIVTAPVLPLTPQGKLDRRALPRPAAPAATQGTSGAAPTTELEATLARMWSEALGLGGDAAPVGVHDNFFDLGGHSLAAVRLLSQIEAAFQVRVAVRTLFEQPTVAALAVAIEDQLLAELEALSDEEARSALEQSDYEG